MPSTEAELGCLQSVPFCNSSALEQVPNCSSCCSLVPAVEALEPMSVTDHVANAIVQLASRTWRAKFVPW